MRTEVFEPAKFYQEFVRRAYDEHCAAPEDQYLAKMAIIQADTMAERVWMNWKDKSDPRARTFRTAGAYRTHLTQNECPEFQLVWDIHDGHKHVSLNRPNRMVSGAGQTGYDEADGCIGGAAVGEVALGESRRDPIVIADDGKVHYLGSILTKVIQMWERLLPSI